MAVDLTKLALHTGYPAFKNNKVYTGTLTISGNSSAGANTRTFDITLDSQPDLLDVTFRGNSAGGDNRPTAAEFKSGEVWVPSNDAGGGNPQPWALSYSVNGSTVTITASYLQTFDTGESLTSTNFTYRIVDYSVF